ncbi:MAG: hypothetical protein Kow0062_26420 [Acidobacteriota bacterium]
MSRDGVRPAPPLAAIQRWMQAVVVSPRPLDEALSAPEATGALPGADVEQLVRPSATLTPAERLAIYKDMYPLRMVEALEQDYPVLAWHVGEETFEQLALDYVAAHPSTSWTLDRLGDHFPRWLAEDCPREDAAFLADLARFELAQTEVFDERPSDVLDGETVARIPSEAWARARLQPVPALRLLELRHAVRPHWDAWQHDSQPAAPRRRATRVVVWRQELSVHWREQRRVEHELLADLVGGAPLAEALARAAERLRDNERDDRLFTWFRRWVADGLFATVVVD